MADTWGDDDDNDEWDVDDDELDAKLALNSGGGLAPSGVATPKFDDEEDLALVEREKLAKQTNAELKKKGNALFEKKAAEKARLEEEEIAKKAMEYENEIQANMTPEELRALERQRIEEADHSLTNDLFGATINDGGVGTATQSAAGGGDKIVLKDMKDHLKYARKVAEALKSHGKIHLSTAFFKECITQCDAVLDDDAVTELIKILNVMKNEKIAAAKKKVKGQAQKSKKVDKAALAIAKKIQVETFGDNDKYDDYDVIGEKYEDDFF
jgi:translation initiation factor 3 subunit J